MTTIWISLWVFHLISRIKIIKCIPGTGGGGCGAEINKIISLINAELFKTNN